ncbi:ANTAR domain-containing protein, partial [Amycolatopsis sp. NPDC004378]
QRPLGIREQLKPRHTSEHPSRQPKPFVRHALVLVTSDEFIARVLRQADRELVIASTHAAALSRLGHQQGSLAAERLDVRHLRNRALIGQVLTVLRDRYQLPSNVEAFTLLKRASQAHNVPVRALAAAIQSMRAPTGPAWFPGRARHPAPVMTLRPAAQTPAALLSAALDAACAVTMAPRGHVHSVEPLAGGLALEHHHRLDTDLVVGLTHLESGTASTHAQHTQQPVIVTDVETSPLFTGELCEAILRNGTRAAQSEPILQPDGHCVGAVTTYYDRPDDLPPTAALTELDRVCKETGRWFDWHRRTILLDALEHLHSDATAAGVTRPVR